MLITNTIPITLITDTNDVDNKYDTDNVNIITMLITNSIPITIITHTNDVDNKHDTDNVNNRHKRC